MMKEIIMITGASSGMGREFAMQIEKKYQVDEIWVIARRKERLENLNLNYIYLFNYLFISS